MIKGFSVASASTTIGLSAFSPALPAQAGNGSAVGAGLVRFGIGAIVGSALSPREVLRRSAAASAAAPVCRPCIMGRWLTDRRHGHRVGMTIAPGATPASIRRPDISSVRTGLPISAARARPRRSSKRPTNTNLLKGSLPGRQ